MILGAIVNINIFYFSFFVFFLLVRFSVICGICRRGGTMSYITRSRGMRCFGCLHFGCLHAEREQCPLVRSYHHPPAYIYAFTTAAAAAPADAVAVAMYTGPTTYVVRTDSYWSVVDWYHSGMFFGVLVLFSLWSYCCSCRCFLLVVILAMLGCWC